MKLSKYIIVLGLAYIISSCASTQKIREPIFLSNSFDAQVQHEVHIFPIIDARVEKDKDLQDIIGYGSSYAHTIESTLETKGYIIKELNLNIRSCPSVANIKTTQDLTCLSGADFSQLNMILLISVDDYTKPKAMSASGLAYVSGVLLNVKTNSVIWKDSIRKGSDDAALLMFGGGGYLGGLLVKALSPNIIYRNDAFASIGLLLQSIPEYKVHKK